MSWGDTGWGSGMWGGFTPTPPTPVPTGDGHVPLCMNKSQSIAIPLTEAVQPGFGPAFNFDGTGKTKWRWHFLGDCFNLDVGKIVTIRVHKGLAFVDPIVASAMVSAAGVFHVESSEATIPTGANRYFLSLQTDDASAPDIRDWLIVVEVYS